MKFPTSAPAGYKSIFRKWWFWVGLLALLFAAWYLNGYFKWYGDQAKYRLQNAVSNDYIASQEKQQAALEAQYKNDPYGGATPEETLGLFVSALKMGELNNASNYYLPEQRSKGLGDLKLSQQRGYIDEYINILQETQKPHRFSDGKTYEIEFFDKQGNQNHVERFKINTFTNKWLISDL